VQMTRPSWRPFIYPSRRWPKQSDRARMIVMWWWARIWWFDGGDDISAHRCSAALKISGIAWRGYC
jgi:hypothetical protein